MVNVLVYEIWKLVFLWSNSSALASAIDSCVENLSLMWIFLDTSEDHLKKNEVEVTLN